MPSARAISLLRHYERSICQILVNHSGWVYVFVCVCVGLFLLLLHACTCACVSMCMCVHRIDCVLPAVSVSHEALQYHFLLFVHVFTRSSFLCFRRMFLNVILCYFLLILCAVSELFYTSILASFFLVFLLSHIVEIMPGTINYRRNKLNRQTNMLVQSTIV